MEQKGEALACFQKEAIKKIWPEMEPLARVHFEEVDGGLDPRRKFDPDLVTLDRMERLGIFQLYTVRAEGRLIGYCSWSLEYDLESRGLMIARQGAWFVLPQNGNLGFRLYKFALGELEKQNVKLVFPHHRLNGRATFRLGDWFERVGAKPEQIEYRLWIEDLVGRFGDG